MGWKSNYAQTVGLQYFIEVIEYQYKQADYNFLCLNIKTYPKKIF